MVAGAGRCPFLEQIDPGHDEREEQERARVALDRAAPRQEVIPEDERRDEQHDAVEDEQLHTPA